MGATAGEAVLYVINLCASTSPLALVHPSDPALKRHTFFVTRHREDGRDRFRLHMGYFATQAEAEVLLVAVRDIYPAAWAGPAPSNGAPRRARAAAAPPAVQAPSAAPVVMPPAAVAPETADSSGTLSRMSNVRAVIAQLSDDSAPVGATRVSSSAPTTPTLAPPPPVPASPPPTLTPAQTLKLLEAQTRPPALTPAPVARGRAPEIPDVPEGSSVRVVTPEDTQALRDIKLDAERNAPPCFAVQLLWAVSPIDTGAHPHLAIFDAYTLYNVEGNRHGRRWYGLRLGFFKDPNAASQVAYYVRSEYPTVAVVPVAQNERDNAAGKGESPRKPATAAPQKPQLQTEVERKGLEGFELLEDDRPRPVKRDVDDVPAAASPTVQKPRATNAPAKAVAKPVAKAPGKPTGKRVVVRKPEGKTRVTPGATRPLDETFELLGASTLTIDEGREVINDPAVRRKPEKKPEGSGGRLSRLLTRLSGR